MAIGIYIYISIITLKVNGINAPTKRRRLAEWLQKQDPYIYIRQKLTDIKEEIDSSTIIVGDINTPLTPMDGSSKQKINKETQVFTATLDEMDLIDIFRTFHPNAEYTFFQVQIEHSPGKTTS